MSRTPARVTQADLARAGRAAKSLGPEWWVEVTPDGTIRLARVPSSPQSTGAAPPSPIEQETEFRL